MINILYIVSTLAHSGPIITLFNLVKNLDRKRFQATVLTLSNEPPNSLKQQFDDSEIKVKTLGGSRFIGFLRAKTRIKEVIILFQPHIIHTHGIRADYFSSKINMSYALLKTIHNFPYEDYTNRYGKILGSLMTRIHLKIINKDHSAYACSKSLAAKFKKINIELKYIQNGVDYDSFDIQRDKNKLRNDYNLPLNKKIFLFSGSFDKVKNISTIIKAIKNIENSILLLAGDGIEKEKLKEGAEDDPNIYFLGWQKNIIDIYHLSDYYISASFSEGLSNSVMEAMACGLPVILSDIESHRELFESEDYGFFFDPNTVDQLQELITKIISEDYFLLSEQVKKIIKSTFSANKMSEKYQDLYITLSAMTKSGALR